MTLDACLARAVGDGFAKATRAEEATALWRDLRDRYRRQGMTDSMADARAAADVRAAFKKKAGEERHAFIAHMDVMRKQEAAVENAADLGSINTDLVEHWEPSKNGAVSLVAQANGLRRLFHKRLADLVTKHHRDLLGNSKEKAGLLNIARELHGQNTGDLAAAAVAKGIKEAFRDMRRMFNEAGGNIGDLDDWGLPHSHDALAITEAGFETWYTDIKGRLAWHRIEDRLTGRPLAAEGATPSEETMREVLREAYDNIAFGRGSGEAKYGAVKGANLLTQHQASRVLHFRTADDWIDYNKRFGSGDVYGSIIGHAHRMAEDIVTLRELGRSPDLMLQYRTDLAIKKAREAGDEALADRIKGNGEQAKRMLRILRGGTQPVTRRQAYWARFFSSTRSVITAALLDRAIVASISDTNSMRMAAKSMGMNQAGPIQRHMSLLFNGMERETMLRAGWVADTLADPGLVLSRWQAEVPPAAIAERLSTGVMRAQGLAHWTDQGRIAFQAETSGLFAQYAGRTIADIDEPLRSILRAKGVTDEDWAAFTNPEHLFTAPNGATFASPIYWREATDLPADKADAVFLKMQAIVEEQTEFAVPTQNVWGRSLIEGDLIPGTLGYEIAKSMTMFKSFPLTFSVNQVGRIMAQQGLKARILYGMDLAAGATVLGALSLQILNLIGGRDLETMDSPSFWGRAMLKGGGFGVMGDLLAIGTTPYGNGYGSFIAGPMWSLADDASRFAVGNAMQLMNGDETNWGRELVRLADRYTPGADLPYISLAMDRLLWDSLQKILDPEAEDALAEAAKKRMRAYDQGMWWMPGSPSPQRMPGIGGGL